MCIDIDNQLYTYKFKSTHIYCTYLKITMISQCSIDWKLKFWDEILIFPMIENALKLCFLHWNLPLRIYALEQTKETFNENRMVEACDYNVVHSSRDFTGPSTCIHCVVIFKCGLYSCEDSITHNTGYLVQGSHIHFPKN